MIRRRCRRWWTAGVRRGCRVGAPYQGFGFADQRALAVETNPAVLGEVGEDFVDRFAGGPDELGEFLLGQVVGDAQCTSSATESVAGAGSSAHAESRPRRIASPVLRTRFPLAGTSARSCRRTCGAFDGITGPLHLPETEPRNDTSLFEDRSDAPHRASGDPPYPAVSSR